ncbi:DotG/IcmE/VirB10 family protein [Vibrio sp. RW]|uniref:DotG/IcmE/VirB10 family protein n=1 Tax=Vibrio sp. RW TaxID=2998833 RepID=UPI0022CDBC8A|nr:DotG/IcmE/VirB10 family protein [Vibrio sp. RW]MDA0146287.1 DotG/IcmE/VirB10 family protein [Vibrio sp. RW]
MKKGKGKKGLIIGSVFVVVAGLIAFATWTASKQVKEELSATGSTTRGSAPVKTDDITEQSVDGSINVPETSPIAQSSQKIDQSQREEAVQAGRSYLGKTRVIPENNSNSTSDEHEPSNSAMPSAQTVNELGEELTAVKHKGENNESKLTGTNITTGDTVVLPLKSSALSQEQSQIEDLKRQLELSQAGQKADEVQLMQEKARQEATLQEQRAKQRKLKITEGAKSLFAGLPFVPDSGGKFKVGYTSKADKYSATTENIFSPKDAKMPAASALHRTDGGQTQPGVHPNYSLEVSKLGDQLAGKSMADDNRSEFDSQAEDIVLFDAGEIAFARTTLPIDSDVPGPIRIKLLNSRAKGSVGFGKMELIQQAPGVALTLTSVIHDGKQIPVKAWALSPDTEKSLFDNEVDHHYIQRFGGLFAGLFMSGFLESLTDTDVTTSNGETNSSTSAIEGTTERIVYSIATAAEGFLPILYNYANRPIQVEVPKGQTMYLLFEKQVLATDRIEKINLDASVSDEKPQQDVETTSAETEKPNIPLAVIDRANDQESYTEIWK